MFCSFSWWGNNLWVRKMYVNGFHRCVRVCSFVVTGHSKLNICSSYRSRSLQRWLGHLGRMNRCQPLMNSYTSCWMWLPHPIRESLNFPERFWLENSLRSWWCLKANSHTSHGQCGGWSSIDVLPSGFCINADLCGFGTKLPALFWARLPSLVRVSKVTMACATMCPRPPWTA